jgi:hypothetical protein
MLYRHTDGNALFTVELVHAMQRRGEVVQDRSGPWVQESPTDWDQLPARVETVVAERLSKLDSESLILLKTASLQGEIFSAGLVARLLGSMRLMIFMTHRIQDIFCTCDRVMVLRRGLSVWDTAIENTSVDELFGPITGRHEGCGQPTHNLD